MPDSSTALRCFKFLTNVGRQEKNKRLARNMSNESYRQLPRCTVNDLFIGDRLQEILKVAFGEQVSETNERDEKIARVVWEYHSCFLSF